MQVPPSAPCAPQIMAPPPPPSSAPPATLALMPDLEVRAEFFGWETECVPPDQMGIMFKTHMFVGKHIEPPQTSM